MAVLNLLPDYSLNEEAGLVRLIAPNGQEVCAFSPNADPREIERECLEHAAKVDAALGLVKRLLEQRRSR